MNLILNIYLRRIQSYTKSKYIKHTTNLGETYTIISFRRRVFKFSIKVCNGLPYFYTYGTNNILLTIWLIE